MNPLTKEQVEELERLEKAATKGPWSWNLNLKSKDVSLEGNTGMRETVIDAQRWGMGGAKLRFLRDGLMVGCDQFAKAHKDREHHKHWCADIDHPDAQIITAMRNNLPELLRGYRAWLAEVEHHKTEIKELSSMRRGCIASGFLRDADVIKDTIARHRARQLEREPHEANLKTEEARRNHFYCNQELHESRRSEQDCRQIITTYCEEIDGLNLALKESRQREERLRDAAETGAKWMGWWLAQAECDCEMSHTCGFPERRQELVKIEQALSTTPAETMVPWSVVKEYVDACFCCDYSEGNPIEVISKAVTRRNRARDVLQSYAPKKGNQ